MTSPPPARPAPRPRPETLPDAGVRRVLGRVAGPRPGPLVLGIAGLHGNEPAGLRALERVMGELGDGERPLRGEFVGLAGNLGALARGVRFVRRDLNRCWTPARIAGLRADSRVPEDREQLALIETLDEVLRGREDEMVVLDLHTTSAPSLPFFTLGDTLRNRSFAGRVGLPLVLGIEERIDGTLLEHLNERGVVTVGVEGGSHADPRSVDYLEAVLWVALVTAGCLDPLDAPDLPRHRASLERARSELAPVFEVRHRHGVRPGDGFVMRPGFRNFQPVRRGEEVARDAQGPVLAPEPGRMFLPLYQELGDDGFFLVRTVRPFWLRVSALLRRVGADAMAPLLPGVRRSRRTAGTLVVNRRVARWYADEVFHLLGYRRKRRAAGHIVYQRRRHDRPRRGA